MEKAEQAVDLNKTFQGQGQSQGQVFHAKPLEGYVVVDFTNVLAGPNWWVVLEFCPQRALVKYQSQSEVIKVYL